MPSDAPAAPSAAPLLSSGMKLGQGRYVIRQMLGAGGMAEVYEAEHAALKKPVALKVLRPEYAAMPEFRERFLREGLAATSIRHAHIVDVTDVGESDGHVYLVMELLEGETLGALMQRQGAIAIAKAVDLVLPVIAALGAAHRVGVVHRDMKPENVFLAKDAQGRTFPKVLDFGISKTTREDAPSLTATSTVLGTPHYMSPEQARGELDVGGPSDQFSLAMVLYELVSGRLPYSADTTLRLIHEVARGDVPPPSAFSSSLFDLDAPMKKALATEPGDRYPTIEGFGVALLPLASPRARSEWESALEGRAVTPSVPPPDGPGGPGTGRRRAAAAATAPQRAAGGTHPRKVSGPRSVDRTPVPSGPTRKVELASADSEGPGLSEPEMMIGQLPQLPMEELALPSKSDAKAEDEAAQRAARSRDETPLQTRRPRVADITPPQRRKIESDPPEATPPTAETLPAAETSRPMERWKIGLAVAVVGIVASVILRAALGGVVERPLAVTPESAEVRVDGAIVTARPVAIPVDDRSHHVEVSAAGYEPRELELAAGAEPPASITLVALPPPPVVVAEPEPLPPVVPEVTPPVAVEEPAEPVVPPTIRTPAVRHPPPIRPHHDDHATRPPPGGGLRTTR